MAENVTGQMQPSDSSTDFNVISFIISQTLARTRTMTLVQVKAVTNEGAVSPVGFVDVQPMVNMLDGAGVAMEHGTVYNVPYTRIQGGTNAIILDPKVGDIGWCAVADRDISSVKESRKVSNPGSFRRFDFSDMVYIGGILNGEPEQYIQFVENEIIINAIDKITLRAPNILKDGDAEITGDLLVDGNIHGLSTLEIDLSAFIHGLLLVGGSATIAQSLLVGGSATITGDLVTNGVRVSGTGAALITRITVGSITVVAVPALGSGATVTYSGTCTGAQVGDRVAISHGGTPGAVIYNAWVSSANTVSVLIFNAYALAVPVPGETMNVICFGV